LPVLRGLLPAVGWFTCVCGYALPARLLLPVTRLRILRCLPRYRYLRCSFDVDCTVRVYSTLRSAHLPTRLVVILHGLRLPTYHGLTRYHVYCRDSHVSTLFAVTRFRWLPHLFFFVCPFAFVAAPRYCYVCCLPFTFVLCVCCAFTLRYTRSVCYLHLPLPAVCVHRCFAFRCLPCVVVVAAFTVTGLPPPFYVCRALLPVVLVTVTLRLPAALPLRLRCRITFYVARVPPLRITVTTVDYYLLLFLITV